jgi:hypothetical protein
MMSTMTHIDEGSLQAFLDGELHLEERRHAERHLQECELCRGELESLKGVGTRFASAIAVLDHAPSAREHAIGWPRARRFSRVRRYLPRAAVLMLFVGGGASAVVASSPVIRWVQELVRSAPTVQTAPRLESVAAPAEERVEAGVSVEAEAGRVEILVHDASQLQVRATLVEGTSAGVFAAGGAASSRFVTGAGRIEVLHPTSGELRIEVPSATPAVTVRINGRQVLTKQDGNLDLSADEPDLDAAGVVFSVEP